MKVLFLAPLFDRVNGMSVASETFFKYLQKEHEIKIVNLARLASRGKYLGRFVRIVEILRICWHAWYKKHNSDVVYFAISESILGNLKDILIMLICYKYLPKCILHLHGGGGMRQLMLGKHTLLAKLNLFFLNKIGAIVVLGKSHVDIYKNVKNQQKIHVVPNFSNDELFVNEEVIERKFQNLNPLKILLISNFLPGKGHLELLQAFLALDENIKQAVRIDFGGEIKSTELKNIFDEAIGKYPQLHYHGVVKGDFKKNLFAQSHIFCLPSYNRTEGQPISILEAYASGCVVFTTHHGGIFDVFEPKRNGFEVDKKSVVSLKLAIEKAVKSPDDLSSFAKNNLADALNFYTEKFFNQNLVKLLEECQQN